VSGGGAGGIVMSAGKSKTGPDPVWRTPSGEPVSCREKLKVLDENLAEIEEMCQDALEDAVLMGCDEAQLRERLRTIVDGLVNPYRDRGRR